MRYGLTDLVWLFFIYSFAGWCMEVCFSAVKILCNCLIVFMIFNMALSSLALARYTQRHTGGSGAEAAGSGASLDAAPEEDPLAAFLDRRFPDERMERIYPNAKLVD